MKIIKNGVTHRNGSGFVKFVAQESEDMYHLYNLIRSGDVIEGSTVRNVVKETASGSVKNRMHMKVRLQVDKIEFDAEQCSLRINGRNVQENEYIKMGQYHTLELELHHPYTLEKEFWDRLHLDSLYTAADQDRKAELLCVVVDEGLSHICLVTNNMTITKARIEKSFPKKNNDNYIKVKNKFFNEIYEQFRKHCDFNRIKVVVIGSPGYWNTDLYTYMLEQSAKAHHQRCSASGSASSGAGESGDREAGSSSSSSNTDGGSGGGGSGQLLLHKHKNRVVLCHSSSARKGGLIIGQAKSHCIATLICTDT